MSPAALHEGIFALEKREGEELTIRIGTAEHPVFLAHFEGNPILPGFMQLDIVAALAERKITGIVMAKFMRPVLPGDLLYCRVTEGEKATRILIRDEEGKSVSDFKLHWQAL